MSKKRRFKKKTLGRLQMFFEKKPYLGFKHGIRFVLQYSCLVCEEVYVTKLNHYNNVTKKKIYYADYTLC